MKRFLQIAEGMIWATGGIFLNIAGVFGSRRFFLPGIILSLSGLLTMTLALSARHRVEEGVLGTSRDGRTLWALRLASISSLIMAAAKLGVLCSLAVPAQVDVILLVAGGIGLLVSVFLLVRLFAK